MDKKQANLLALQLTMELLEHKRISFQVASLNRLPQEICNFAKIFSDELQKHFGNSEQSNAQDTD